MRFHVVSLPHTQVTDNYSACAYTEKVRKFCIMMTGIGHTVYLYAGAENEAPCDELITCISEGERQALASKHHFTSTPFDSTNPHWAAFNNRAAAEIRRRALRKDFLCLIGGHAQKPVADQLPGMMAVEFGIGYGGTFAKFRVFESYAWMHTVYGAQAGDSHAANGFWYDAVIPGYLEAERFPFESKKQNYFLFVGRLIERKGYQIAVDACKARGARLIVAGQGNPPSYGEYAGVVGPEERGRLMAGAKALFAPTIYIEPFGNVVPEAMACGTPVITTDWGAFTETVIQGRTGFRCRTFSELLNAMDNVEKLSPSEIRQHALANYSLEAVAPKYDAYFHRLMSLWGDGWYST